jgi:PAB-dependent poly(A)-specific ribonuclease subunit 2
MPSEAVWFNLTWKIPCVFLYQAKVEPTAIKAVNFLNPITAEVFLEDKSLALKGRKRITFSPLSHDEMPQKAGLVAIDAEFVTLNQEESELRSDGKVSTIKAAQM